MDCIVKGYIRMYVLPIGNSSLSNTYNYSSAVYVLQWPVREELYIHMSTTKIVNHPPKSYCWYRRGSLLRCDNWWIDLDEHIHSRINQSIATDCRTFQPQRLSSTEYKNSYAVDFCYVCRWPSWSIRQLSCGWAVHAQRCETVVCPRGVVTGGHRNWGEYGRISILQHTTCTSIAFAEIVSTEDRL